MIYLNIQGEFMRNWITDWSPVWTTNSMKEFW
jgi:hypothetical protein